MVDSDQKTTTLLVNLNKLTSLGRINWHLSDPPASIAVQSDDHIPIYASARYDGSVYGLLLKRQQLYDRKLEVFYWAERVSLVLLDNEANVQWEIANKSSALIDLFQTVRRKMALANVEESRR